MSDKKDRPFLIRTDLAMETQELLKEGGNEDISGIETETKDYETLKVTSVKITNEDAAFAFGKPRGSYITIETTKMQINDVSCHEKISEVMAEIIKKLIKLKGNDTVLIIGLGNWNITPDALGPQTVSKILVTRHLEGSVPEELGGDIRPVAAVSPGVMGITGIETMEIVKGLVERIKPSLVIAVDALAARKLSRVNTTIQITDTGVMPGSGVGNRRVSLNEETLGVPVIAIGVPTVVDAATLVNDSMDRIIDDMVEFSVKEHKEFYNMLFNLKNEEKYEIIKSLLEPCGENMFVTPKDVDSVIKRLSGIIANGINLALQYNLCADDINKFLNI